MVAVVQNLMMSKDGGTVVPFLTVNLGTAQGGNGPYALASMLVDATGTPIGAGEPLAIYDGYQAAQTVTWNSATAVNTALTFNTAGMDTVAVTINPSGSITAGALTFEVYDGTNWMPIKAPRLESYYTDQVFQVAGASLHSWTLPVAGFPQARVRLSTAITGTGSLPIVGLVSSTPDTSIVTVGADPTQGAGRTRVNSAATTNATVVKATPGVVTGLMVVNTNAAARYVKLYDKATAPVPGTDIPALTVQVPASGQVILPLSIMGMAMANGIGFAMTVNAADTDATAVAAGDLLMTLLWN